MARPSHHVRSVLGESLATGPAPGAHRVAIRAIGLVAITPLAMLLVHLAAPAPIDALLLSRLVETALGVGVGALAIVAIRPWRRRQRAT